MKLYSYSNSYSTLRACDPIPKTELLKVFDNVLLLIMSIHWFNLEYTLKISEKSPFCSKPEDKYEIEERFHNIGNLITSTVNF